MFNKAVTGIPPHPNEGEYKYYLDTIKIHQILGQLIILVYKSSYKNRLISIIIRSGNQVQNRLKVLMNAYCMAAVQSPVI